MSEQGLELSIKEAGVLEAVSKNDGLSQRQISEKTHISLGLVNSILKRLIREGYVEAIRLNHKKLSYHPTEKGLTVKGHLYEQMARLTIQKFWAIQRQIGEQILFYYSQGFTVFFVSPNGELSQIIQASVPLELADKVTFRSEIADAGDHAILLRPKGGWLPEGYAGPVGDLNLEVAL